MRTKRYSAHYKAMQFFTYGCAVVLITIIGTTIFRVRKLNVDVASTAIQNSAAALISSQPETKLRNEVQRLQEENAKLRSLLFESQQKTSKFNRKSRVFASDNTAPTASILLEKTSPRIRKVAEFKRAKRSQKSSKFSFD